MERTVEVSLSLEGRAPVSARATLVDRSVGDRLKRAATGLGLVWAFAALGFFIPLLHFILVPGFLIAGVVVALIRARDGCSMVSVQGACPRCKVTRTFETSGRYYEGRTFFCDQCAEQVIVKAGPAS